MKTILLLSLALASAPAFATEAKQPSRWYCISESPSNMQSSGHIGYGHGASKEEAAVKAVASCRLDGGDGCGAAQCFRE